MLKRNTFMGCFARASSPSRGCLRTSVPLMIMLVSLVGQARMSHAQATATAEKSGGVDAFGALNITASDHAGDTDIGGTVGGALLLRRFIFGQPALAVRYSYMQGSSSHETFVGGGVELHYHLRLVRPYVTLLGGVGGLSIPSVNYSDSGDTFVFGGGVDVPINRRFAVRGEVTYTYIDFTGYHNTSAGAFTLNPVAGNIGVVYHIK
jgi:hypothetical protein